MVHITRNGLNTKHSLHFSTYFTFLVILVNFPLTGNDICHSQPKPWYFIISNASHSIHLFLAQWRHKLKWFFQCDLWSLSNSRAPGGPVTIIRQLPQNIFTLLLLTGLCRLPGPRTVSGEAMAEDASTWTRSEIATRGDGWAARQTALVTGKTSTTKTRLRQHSHIRHGQSKRCVSLISLGILRAGK